MSDEELVGMAVFRLRETLRRFEQLKTHADAAAVRTWLNGVTRQLRQQAERGTTVGQRARARAAVGGGGNDGAPIPMPTRRAS